MSLSLPCIHLTLVEQCGTRGLKDTINWLRTISVVFHKGNSNRQQNKLKSLKVAKSKADGAVDVLCNVVCDVLCYVVCDVVCDVVCVFVCVFVCIVVCDVVCGDVGDGVCVEIIDFKLFGGFVNWRTDGWTNGHLYF